jgi:hypothetical protein
MKFPMRKTVISNTRNRDYTQRPSDQECIDALKENTPEIRALYPDIPSQKELYGCPWGLPDGQPVGLRIDIPAYEKHGIYVITVHCPRTGAEVGKVGKRIGYVNYARVAVASFFVERGAPEKIAIGKIAGGKDKFPCATVEGIWNPDDKIPRDIEDWLPVGFNPKRANYFYSKRDFSKVTGGAEAISVGNTVFVYDPVYQEA